MDRLTEKLKAAGEVVARQAAKIEARADALIAREATIEARTDKSFVPHETVLDRTEIDLDALYQKLALMSNHPLGESGDSSKAEEPPATQQPGSTASTEPGA